MFQAVHALRTTQHLDGCVVAGLVKNKPTFLKVLELFETPDFELAKQCVTEGGLDGSIYINSIVPGHRMVGGVLQDVRVHPSRNLVMTSRRLVVEKSIIFGGSYYGIGRGGRIYGARLYEPMDIKCVGLTDDEWTRGLPEQPGDTSFAVIYYAGHGALNGDLQIQEDEAITPKELFNKSKESGIPYCVILDMCYAGRFAERYMALVERAKWGGFVMSSCAGEGLAFESSGLRNFPLFRWPVEIFDPKWESGAGIYTCVVSLGLTCLRYFELTHKARVYLTIKDFNDSVVKPLCKWVYDTLREDERVPLEERESLQLQEPELFGGYMPSPVGSGGLPAKKGAFGAPRRNALEALDDQIIGMELQDLEEDAKQEVRKEIRALMPFCSEDGSRFLRGVIENVDRFPVCDVDPTDLILYTALTAQDCDGCKALVGLLGQGLASQVAAAIEKEQVIKHVRGFPWVVPESTRHGPVFSSSHLVAALFCQGGLVDALRPQESRRFASDSPWVWRLEAFRPITRADIDRILDR